MKKITLAFIALVMFGCAPTIPKEDMDNLNIYEIYKKYYPDNIVNEDTLEHSHAFIKKTITASSMLKYTLTSHMDSLRESCNDRSGQIYFGAEPAKIAHRQLSNPVDGKSFTDKMNASQQQDYAFAGLKANIESACTVDGKVEFITKRFKVEDYYYSGNRGLKAFTQIDVPKL